MRLIEVGMDHEEAVEKLHDGRTEVRHRDQVVEPHLIVRFEPAGPMLFRATQFRYNSRCDEFPCGGRREP